MKTRKIIKELRKASNLKVIAEDTAADVKKRTRLGNGVAKHGGKKFKLAPLKDKTVDRREFIDLSDMTKPTRSNLTETGKMLDSLVGKSSKGNIKIEISDNERAKIAASHHKHSAKSKRVARPFMFLSNMELKRLNKKINALAKKIIARYF